MNSQHSKSDARTPIDPELVAILRALIEEIGDPTDDPTYAQACAIDYMKRHGVNAD